MLDKKEVDPEPAREMGGRPSYDLGGTGNEFAWEGSRHWPASMVLRTSVGLVPPEPLFRQVFKYSDIAPPSVCLFVSIYHIESENDILETMTTEYCSSALAHIMWK